MCIFNVTPVTLNLKVPCVHGHKPRWCVRPRDLPRTRWDLWSSLKTVAPQFWGVLKWRALSSHLSCWSIFNWETNDGRGLACFRKPPLGKRWLSQILSLSCFPSLCPQGCSSPGVFACMLAEITHSIHDMCIYVLYIYTTGNIYILCILILCYINHSCHVDVCIYIYVPTQWWMVKEIQMCHSPDCYAL